MDTGPWQMYLETGTSLTASGTEKIRCIYLICLLYAAFAIVNAPLAQFFELLT